MKNWADYETVYTTMIYKSKQQSTKWLHLLLFRFIEFNHRAIQRRPYQGTIISCLQIHRSDRSSGPLYERVLHHHSTLQHLHMFSRQQQLQQHPSSTMVHLYVRTTNCAEILHQFLQQWFNLLHLHLHLHLHLFHLKHYCLRVRWT